VFKHHEAPEEIPQVDIPRSVLRTQADGSWILAVPALLEALGLVASRSEARRLLAQDGVRVDGATERREEISLDGEGLGPFAGTVWQVGRRRFARIGSLTD
jgi:tyrosyl-tRNA synthetase